MSVENENEKDIAVHADVDESPKQKRKRPPLALLLVILIVAVIAGVAWYIHSSSVEYTDDAQVDGYLNPIAARVDGTIQSVSVIDNQSVQAGQLLVKLDPSYYKVALDEATAQFDQAEAQLGASNPNLPITKINNATNLVAQKAAVADASAKLASAQSDLESTIARLKQSQAINDRDQADFQRYRTLYEKKEVARADYDRYKAAAAAQSEAVAANRSAVDSARKTIEEREADLNEQQSKFAQIKTSAPLQMEIRRADISSQQANAEGAKAALEKAQLDLNHCKVVAPVAGVIAERSAETGARISTGQQLMVVVQIKNLWVTANFKETQLAYIHPGQRVRIKVDALDKDFKGTVESLAAVTGARTSVLPPENATGNYVKVIQRMPVRIRFNPGQDGLNQLRPGMSVEPTVYLH